MAVHRGHAILLRFFETSDTTNDPLRQGSMALDEASTRYRAGWLQLYGRSVFAKSLAVIFT